MLEVVFSDSVAGAMLVAIGHQHSVGGAIAVIFANEDGEQNATIPQAEIEKFQREAEERERRGWENAVPFEGKRENIVNLPLALSVGHISQTGIGTEREEAISLLTGTFPDIASQVVEEMLDTARKSYAELLKQVQNGEPIRIWASREPDADVRIVLAHGTTASGWAGKVGCYCCGTSRVGKKTRRLYRPIYRLGRD